MKLTKAHIGRCGEILVQYRLLLGGVESAAMTTDSGIDLVAYFNVGSKADAVTIQVKTNLQPKPAGGRGSMALDWWIRKSSPAELVALVDLSTESIWLFWHSELERAAQQKQTNKLHFYGYLDDGVIRRPGKHIRDYTNHLFKRGDARKSLASLWARRPSEGLRVS
jgi:hypothetical protein